MQITTEITSSQIASDNPIHQRLLFAYEAANQYINGSVLEVGCGEGRGLETIASNCQNYTALDKNDALLALLAKKYPTFSFIHTNVPPFENVADNSFDTIVCFQVIEHIQNDNLFVSEIARVLKPGGKAIISTPNIDLTLSRNPWHIREYKPKQLKDLLLKYFSNIEDKGISGNQKVMDYYELNKKSVKNITRWDIFNLQYKLPASVLRIPYDILNRFNRNKMMKNDVKLVSDIALSDYFVTNDFAKSFDLFYVCQK